MAQVLLRETSQCLRGQREPLSLLTIRFALAITSDLVKEQKQQRRMPCSRGHMVSLKYTRVREQSTASRKWEGWPIKPAASGSGGGGAEVGREAGTELSTSSPDITETSLGESHILKKPALKLSSDFCICTLELLPRTGKSCPARPPQLTCSEWILPPGFIFSTKKLYKQIVYPECRPLHPQHPAAASSLPGWGALLAPLDPHQVPGAQPRVQSGLSAPLAEPLPGPQDKQAEDRKIHPEGTQHTASGASPHSPSRQASGRHRVSPVWPASIEMHVLRSLGSRCHLYWGPRRFLLSPESQPRSALGIRVSSEKDKTQHRARPCQNMEPTHFLWRSPIGNISHTAQKGGDCFPQLDTPL